jgi:hypothetical protein
LANCAADNGTNGVVANGAGVQVWMSNLTISGNTNALSSGGGAQLFTYKNNNIDGNGALGSAPTLATQQ